MFRHGIEPKLVEESNQLDVLTRHAFSICFWRRMAHFLIQFIPLVASQFVHNLISPSVIASHAYDIGNHDLYIIEISFPAPVPISAFQLLVAPDNQHRFETCALERI